MRGKISNFFILAGLGVGSGWRFINEGAGGLGQYFINAICLIIVMYPLFILGTIGAGDIKLLAVAEGFFGLGDGIKYLIFTLVVGACIGVVKMLVRQNAIERLWYMASYIKEVAVTGKWKLYFDNKQEERKKDYQICMTIPMLISFLLYRGGMY